MSKLHAQCSYGCLQLCDVDNNLVHTSLGDFFKAMGKSESETEGKMKVVFDGRHVEY